MSTPSAPSSGASWLVRTAGNVLAGPYTREQIVGLIQEGKLGLQDEVCRGSCYWIYLHEHQEVLDQLGIRMPKASRGKGTDDDEVTETQVDTLSGEEEERVLPPEPPSADGGTAVIARGPWQRPSSARPTGVPQSRGVSGIERPSIWRGFAWLMIVAACLVVALVLRALRGE